ncbi:hypothetical protein LJR235_000642 [Pararhizobium sp. LjRoot235]|uniref:hypothetical protein n=1 Tax=Pararhizobium sp. LjRoot235 TaxID=3342291 RepID=UPI003ECD8750
MPPMKSIPAPAEAGSATAAIRPSFDDLVEMSGVSVAAAAGADMPEAFVALAHRAQSVGWRYEDAEEAIRQLAREKLGAQGAAFD